MIKPQNAKLNSVFVFDAISCDKQDCMSEYFSMGRHSSVDCFIYIKLMHGYQSTLCVTLQI